MTRANVVRSNRNCILQRIKCKFPPSLHSTPSNNLHSRRPHSLASSTSASTDTSEKSINDFLTKSRMQVPYTTQNQRGVQQWHERNGAYPSISASRFLQSSTSTNFSSSESISFENDRCLSIELSAVYQSGESRSAGTRGGDLTQPPFRFYSSPKLHRVQSNAEGDGGT